MEEIENWDDIFGFIDEIPEEIKKSPRKQNELLREIFGRPFNPSSEKVMINIEKFKDELNHLKNADDVQAEQTVRIKNLPICFTLSENISYSEYIICPKTRRDKRVDQELRQIETEEETNEEGVTEDVLEEMVENLNSLEHPELSLASYQEEMLEQISSTPNTRSEFHERWLEATREGRRMGSSPTREIVFEDERGHQETYHRIRHSGHSHTPEPDSLPEPEFFSASFVTPDESEEDESEEENDNEDVDDLSFADFFRRAINDNL